MKRKDYQHLANECAAKAIICAVGALIFTTLTVVAGFIAHAPAIAILCACAVVLCIFGAVINSRDGAQASLRASLTRFDHNDHL